MSADWQDWQADDEHDIIPVPVEEQTVYRLGCLSRITGVDPLMLAASLLKDVIDDDYIAHTCAVH